MQFVNAYLEEDRPLCTFCDANPLNGGSGEGGSVIDHILVRGFEGRVVVDGNHPLAGQRLRFDCTVLDVRTATPDELEHGHVHGPGAHH